MGRKKVDNHNCKHLCVFSVMSKRCDFLHSVIGASLTKSERSLYSQVHFSLLCVCLLEFPFYFGSDQNGPNLNESD